MTDNEKIHKILKYICNAEKQDGFDSSEISQHLGLMLEETNSLLRKIIENGDVKEFSHKDILSKGAVGILKTTKTAEAYKLKKYMTKKPLMYNLYFICDYSAFNLFNVTEEKLAKIINAYRKKLRSFTLSGKEYFIAGLREIKIFSIEVESRPEEFEKHWKIHNFGEYKNHSYIYTDKCLSQLGKDVTDSFIGDDEYGCDKEPDNDFNPVYNNMVFVDESRLQELKDISNTEFDLSKLIKLCEEINLNYKYGCFLSVGMIGRTIINHIPPIFGYEKFIEVVNNYGGVKSNISFKKSMGNLNNSLKNIADGILHQTIRKQEILPNETQIDFKNDLDVLLAEIIRILK